MTAFALFSATSPTKVTPALFAAMPLHMQSELVLLLAERGMSNRQIAHATGLNRAAQIRDLQEARPLYRLPRAAQYLGDHGEDEGDGQRPRKLYRAVDKVLRLIAAAPEGVLVIGRRDVAVRAGISETATRHALETLSAEGMTTLVRRGAPGKPSIWSITDKGRAYVERGTANA